MSIWTRNHTELAKLAKTLQDRNVQTRNKLSKRLAVLSQPNPLDPRKSRSESCLLSVPEEEAKENIFSRMGGDDPDEGTAKRLRVDSFSSVDSAISPDFSRGSLSPILKQSYLTSSDPGSRKYSPCNRVPNSRASDKRVTFFLLNGDGDETDSTANDNGTSLNGDLCSNIEKDLCDGNDISTVSTHETNGCESVPSNSKSNEESNYAVDLNKPSCNSILHSQRYIDSVVDSSHSNAEVLLKRGVSDLSVGNHSAFHPNSPESTKQSTANTGKGSKSVCGSHDSNITDPLIGKDNHRSTELIEVPEVVLPQEENVTSTQDDEKTASLSMSTAGLNLSSELNLLLISLLVNHRREQLLMSQKDISASDDINCPQGAPGSDYPIPLNIKYQNGDTTQNAENSELEVDSVDATRPGENNFILRVEKLENTNDIEKETNVEGNFRNDIIENIKPQVKYENHTVSNTTSIENSRNIPNETDHLERGMLIHTSTSGTLLISKESQCAQNSSSIEPVIETVGKDASIPLFLNASNPLPTPFPNPPSLSNGHLSTVHCQGYCIPASSAKYTVAGNAPSTFVYSHLYQQPAERCNSTYTLCLGEGGPASTKQNSFILDKTHMNNAYHQSSDVEHSIPEFEAAITFADVKPKGAVESTTLLASCKNANNTVPQDLLNTITLDKQNANRQNVTVYETTDMDIGTRTLNLLANGMRGSSVSKLFENAEEKEKDLFFNFDTISQTQNLTSNVHQNVSKKECITSIISHTKSDGLQHLADLDRCVMFQRVSGSERCDIFPRVADPPQTSMDSLQRPSSSAFLDNGNQAITNSETLNTNGWNEETNKVSSFDRLESISNCIQTSTGPAGITPDKDRMTCEVQRHVGRHFTTFDLLKQHNPVPSTSLSSPIFQHYNDYDVILPSKTVNIDISSNGKKDILLAPVSSYPSCASVVTQTESKANLDALFQVKNSSVSPSHSEIAVYSDDTVYRSSSTSLTRDTHDLHSVSRKHQHRYTPRLARSLRYHDTMDQKMHIESSSYDTEESSVFWNRRNKKDNHFSSIPMADKTAGSNELSLRHQLKRINENISWIMKSQNVPSNLRLRGDCTSSGTPRRRKKSRNSDSSSSHRHVGRGKSYSDSSRDNTAKFTFEKMPPQQRASEPLDAVHTEARRLNVFNFVFGSSKTSVNDDQGNFLSDATVEEFQSSLENFNLFDGIHKHYPSRNLKAVKDTLSQLSEVLRQQHHCNKENVMKEISDRSKFFRKFDSKTSRLKNNVQVPSTETENDSKQYTGNPVPEGSTKVGVAHNREKQTMVKCPSPPSLILSGEEATHQNGSKEKELATMVRKTDLLNMENLLDKIINMDADALCNVDALQKITDEWRLMKPQFTEADYLLDQPLKICSGSTNGLIQENPFRQTPVPPLPKNGHCLEDNSSSVTEYVSNEISILTETSHDKPISKSTEAANQSEDLIHSTLSAPHVSRVLSLADDLHEHQKADDSCRDCEGLRGKTETSAAMESDSQLSFRCDREFDKNLADMKPYVLKLPLKTDRQKCAVWIKKFCEPPGSGLTLRKTRNMYAQLMVQMLRKGTLASPFDQKPQDGPLQPLPSHMSIYFEDLYPSGVGQAEHLPDWVEGELGDTGVSSAFPHSLGNPAATSTWVSSVGDFRERPHSSMGHTLDKDPSLSPIRHSEYGHSKAYSVDDMSIEVKGSSSSPPQQRRKSHNSPEREKRQLPDIKVREEKEDRRHQDHSHNDTDWSKPYASSISLPKGTTFHEDISYHKPTDREVAVRTKMIEAKFHEEKLKLQQKHDAAVQKILDRKNTEIEDVKNHYRVKSKEMEETIGKLEKKVQTLMKETEYVRENKDKQISEMKKLAENSNENRRKEFEKRLHDIMSEFEQEKFDMQKQHTQNIQEILDDTNSRLQRMEAEYSQQTTTTTNVIKELESRVQQLMNEVDSSLSQRSLVEKDRNETQAKLEKVTDEYERIRERYQHIERDHQIKTETHEHDLRSLKNKTEASLEFLKQEHTMAASKASDTISELEQKVDQLKKSLKDSEENRHRQNREMEQVHQQDKLHMENLHDKQVRNMKKEMEQLESDWTKKMAKSEQQIKDKEGEISKLREQKQQQAIQAEQALEEFKSQVEKNQTRMYDEMKQQMEQVENDLSKSKQLREKQAKEFTRQQEEDKYKQQHEIAELKMSFEGDKSQLMRDFHIQKEYIISEHDKELENLKEIHRAEIQAMEARMRERQDKSDKTATDGERLIRELREELVQANQLRKQQLVELGLLREEEKQKVQRDHEAELSRFRTDMEQQRLEQQKINSAEMESMLEKTNGRLKGIEQEYAERGKKSAESIAELQSVVLQLRGDIKRSRESSDEKLAELKHQYEEERQNLRKQYSQNMMSMQKELESQHGKSRDLERQLQTEESDQEEKVTQLKLQFEEKIRGLMPADVKQELEDTIASLKSQVASLQQRALMLQEELDSRNQSKLGPFGSRTSSPIKSTV